MPVAERLVNVEVAMPPPRLKPSTMVDVVVAAVHLDCSQACVPVRLFSTFVQCQFCASPCMCDVRSHTRSTSAEAGHAVIRLITGCDCCVCRKICGVTELKSAVLTPVHFGKVRVS